MSLKRIAVMIILLALPALASSEDRTFHPMDLTKYAQSVPGSDTPTHIKVSGYVLYVKVEDDGDWHIRLCDSMSVKGMDTKHCIVAEVIPSMQNKLHRPKVGSQVTVLGISRYDGHHKWNECHPIEDIQ